MTRTLAVPAYRPHQLLAATALALMALAWPHLAWAEDLSPDEKKLVCADRPTCQVTQVTPAGKGAKGERLRIADLVFGLADLPNYFPEEGCRSTEEALENMDKVDGGREIWLLADGAPPVKLLPLCNDGYGSAQTGYDEIEVGDNRLTHTQSGGSAWRWDTATTFQLSPLALIGESDCSYHNAAPETGELTVVDRRKLEARAFAPAPRKDWSDAEIGCPVATTDFAKPLDPQPEPGVVAAYAVPMPFDVDPSPLPAGTTLGTCGLSVKSDGSKGFLVYGKPAAAGDAAEMRVIAETGKSLLIQVYDPLAAQAVAGASWISRPHVEIWTAAEGEQPEGDTEQGPVKQYFQLGIGLDGSVNVGARKPAALPKVTSWPGKDEAGRDVTVLRVTWDDEAALIYGVGVVYSQAEGGKQARLAATAPIKKNKPLFLPGIWHNSQDESGAPGGMCEFSGESHQLDL
ncbi:hypothetical protein [Dongia rigui]|uniref:Uncharacterized protein n=1 Tax=Dongia rigui TaxID=940149 RepID=A0ABU5E3V3_9PROT|nr:hypothetical protein [Dongia rigui]MDY0873496.1 hypothetical protein [Dongia rigui]